MQGARQAIRGGVWLTLAALAVLAPFGHVLAPAVGAQDTPAATPATSGSEAVATPVTVTGAILFPENLTAGPPATIHVRIEDVSRADAPATVLASATLEDVAVPPAGEEPVTFAIPVDRYDARLRYGVRVHVDRDGDGLVGVGDLVSTEHHPVLTHGGGTEAAIAVSEVSGAASATAAAMPPVVWELIGYTATGAEPVDVAEPARYTLQFLPEGRLLARLDCNQGRGGYAAADGVLTLTPMAATVKRCLPGSHDADFGRLLSQSAAYRFDPDGALLLRGAAGVLRLQAALTGVLWQWQGNVANDGAATLTPTQPEHYTVAFLADGALAIQADCNRGRGTYRVSGSGIDVRVGGVTKMACPPGSLMTPFLEALDGAVSYGIHGGDLALALTGGGMMVFAPVFVEPEAATPAAG